MTSRLSSLLLEVTRLKVKRRLLLPSQKFKRVI